MIVQKDRQNEALPQKRSDRVAQACDPRTWEMEARRSRFQGHCQLQVQDQDKSGLHKKTCPKTKFKLNF